MNTSILQMLQKGVLKGSLAFVQRFKFVNWRIRFFDATNRLYTYFTDSKQKVKDEIPKSVIVLWSDAPMAKFMSRVRPRALLEYTVEINPPTEAPLKSHLYHDIPDFAGVNNPVATIGETKSLISSINKKGSGTGNKV